MVFANNEFKEMIEFFEIQKDTDIWKKCRIKEIEVRELPQAPILLSQIRQDLDIETSVSDDTISEAMKLTGIVATFPISKLSTYPIGETAIQSLSARAGLFGPTIKRKPLVLNEGLMEYSEHALVLVRNGKVLAAHSGESNGYGILPVADLLDSLLITLDADFPGYVFDRASYADELTVVQFSLKGQQKLLLDEYNKILRQNNMQPVKDMIPMLLFDTNDIGQSGANLHPCFMLNGKLIRFGESISTQHRAYNDISDFFTASQQLFTLFKDNTQKVASLSSVKLNLALDCFKNIVKTLKLPITASEEAYEDFNILMPLHPTALDVYLALWGIVDKLQIKEAPISTILKVQEQLTKLVNAKWSDYDRVSF